MKVPLPGHAPLPSNFDSHDAIEDLATFADIDPDLNALLSAANRPDLLLRRAVKLARENIELRKSLTDVQSNQAALRQELDSLCEPENYPAVITNVECDGVVHVNLHVPGMSPVRARVHPNVPLNAVRVGARGYVSKGRNCLLEIDARDAEWREIGTFEERLNDGRIVVMHRDLPRVLVVADDLNDVELAKGDRIGFDDGAAIAFARIPANRGEHLFVDTPEDDFANLGGLESQIRLLKRAVELTFKFPDIARRYRLPTKQGILLSGPPGTGKTRLARCLASHVRYITGENCRFQSVVGSEDFSMWLGGTEARLKERFAAAREAALDGPCVIFIDEIDAIGRCRGTECGSGAPDRILSTLLGLMDDVQKTLTNVILVGATNQADLLDPGLTRPGRLDLKVTVPRPSRNAAAAIMRQYLGRDLPIGESNVETLIAPLLSRVYSPRGEYAEVIQVRYNDGRQVAFGAKDVMNGAMLEHVVRRAAESAAVREADSGQMSSVTGEDLAISLKQELFEAVDLLSPTNVKSYIDRIPRDARPVEVVVLLRREGSYLRPA